MPSSPSSRVTVVRGIGLAVTRELAGNIDATAIVCTRPEEVAKLIACLASNNFSFATGNTMIVDGGTVLLSFTW